MKHQKYPFLFLLWAVFQLQNMLIDIAQASNSLEGCLPKQLNSIPTEHHCPHASELDHLEGPFGEVADTNGVTKLFKIRLPKDEKLLLSLEVPMNHLIRFGIPKLDSNQTEIAPNILPEYLKSRIETDDSAEGILMIRSEKGQHYMVGFGWITPFTSWAKDISFKDPKKKGSKGNKRKRAQTNHLMFSPRFKIVGEPDGSQHKIFPNVAELAVISSLGPGLGYGKFILQKLENIATKQGYQHMILDAAKGVEGFYQKMGYQEVPVWGKHIKYKREQWEPYRHWIYPDQDVYKENILSSNMMLKNFDSAPNL